MTDPDRPTDGRLAGRGLEDQPPPAEAEPTGFLQTTVGVITSPTATFRAIAREEPLARALLVVVVASVILAVVQSAELAPDAQGAPQLAPEVLVSLIVGVPVALLAFVVWTAVVLLFAKMFGGAGGFRGTATGLGFAYVPLVVGSIVSALALPFGAAAGAFIAVVLLASTVWSFVLDILAVREVHRFGTGRAVGAVLLPIALFGVLILLLFATILAVLFTAM